MWCFYTKNQTQFWNKKDIPLQIFNSSTQVKIANFTKKGKRLNLNLIRTYYLIDHHLFYSDRQEFGKVIAIKGHCYLGTVYLVFQENQQDFLFYLNHSGHILTLHTSDQKLYEIWKKYFQSKCVQFKIQEQFTIDKLIGGNKKCSVIQFCIQYFYQVNQCIDKKTNLTYSVKSIKKQGFSYDEFKKQVMNEVYVLQNVNHQSLLKINYIFEDEKKIHIITDLYSGGELISNKNTSFNLQLQEIKAILYKLLDAVRELHFKGFMHRDIKPQNILYKSSSDKTNIVLIDMGSCVQINDKDPPYPNCGTLGFIAPEILNYRSDKKMYTPKCDVFSLGITFFTLFYSYNPIIGKSKNETLQNNVNVNIDFTNLNQIPLPASALDLLKKMVKGRAKERITCEEAMEHEFFHSQISDHVFFKVPKKIQTYEECQKNLSFENQKSYSFEWHHIDYLKESQEGIRAKSMTANIKKKQINQGNEGQLNLMKKEQKEELKVIQEQEFIQSKNISISDGLNEEGMIGQSHINVIKRVIKK